MAHAGPRRNATDPTNLFYLQWHAVDDPHHGRRSLSVIPASKAESIAAAALLECRAIQFVTLATGTYEYCTHKRKYYDELIVQARQAQRDDIVPE